MKVIRAQCDPFFQAIDNGDGLTFLLDRNDHVIARSEWETIKEQVDKFYSICTDQEIMDHNRQADEQKARKDNRVVERIPSPAPVAKSAGYVYLLRGIDTPWYKIGLSINAKKRLRQIGAQGPFELETVHVLPVDDMAGVESHFHQLFSDKRAHGEWFTLSPDDVQTFMGWNASKGR